MVKTVGYTNSLALCRKALLWLGDFFRLQNPWPERESRPRIEGVKDGSPLLCPDILEDTHALRRRTMYSRYNPSRFVLPSQRSTSRNTKKHCTHPIGFIVRSEPLKRSQFEYGVNQARNGEHVAESKFRQCVEGEQR